jgi:putative ABC transport system permease protein
VGDTKQYNLDEADVGFVYGAQAQNPDIFNTLAVRTTGDPMQLATAVRAAVWSVDPEQPVWKVRTQQSLVERAKGMPRFLAQLMGGYAALALLLAAVGLYGVTSYAVTQRTHEIGLRMALGAGREQVVRQILREGMVTAVIGVVLGTVGAYLVGRAMQGMWFGVGIVDPAAFSVVAGLLLSSAILACLVPARRAASIDPMVALRQE